MATSSGAGTSSEKPPLQMKHVDFGKDHITADQRKHMEMMEKKVQEHAAYMKRVGRKNTAMAIGLGLAVVGIFSYSIYSVGRESFLDNFDDPNKPKD
ncbi:cytochrome c oxidase assembly factor 3, mitochondrial-like [Amphiura filiformis]|uniref:cytochrome c oxidase assembly factor 3, mitochondrial-like n=1 Tax=Amphiura filiformis TaxID=82378 RepID=UPI003B223ED1